MMTLFKRTMRERLFIEQNLKLELFWIMAEGLEQELLCDRGHADVYAVVNCAALLSLALRGESDPGVVCGSASGVSAQGAPYSKPAAGKVKVRCVNWEDGCEVRGKKRGLHV